MSDGYEKYALYWVPKRTDPLARFGASWTGWCADQGERRSLGEFGGLSVETATITRHCRRHGFHGVIKAPFRLGAGRSRFALEHVLGLLAEDSVAFKLPRLRLAVVGGCVALVPSQASQALGDLVNRVGEVLTPLDAAVSANGFAESTVGTPAHASQRSGAATPDPVIKFPTAATHRFHMPLTDPIGPELALEVMEKLQPVLERILQEPRQLRDLALMGDPGEGRPLRLLLRYELRDWPQRGASDALPCQGPQVLMADFNDPRARCEMAS